MKFSTFDLLRNQYSAIATVDDFRTDLSGKTVIVTGGNTGLGFECSKHIASMMGKGPDAGKLIIACRTVSKGEEALQAIRDATGYTGGEAWEVDFTKFNTVSAFADRYEREGPGHLDLLIENSGIVSTKYTKTQDGWESTIQTNHLGQALLAFLMLPYLSKAKGSPPTPRLTIVSSDRHYPATISKEEIKAPKLFEKLSDEAYCTTYVMLGRYNLSKLLNVLFTRALASKIPQSSPLIVNNVNPGFCKSSLAREATKFFVFRIFFSIMSAALAKSTEEGGRSIAHAALVVDPRKAMNAHEADKLSEADASDPKALNGKFISWTRIAEESDFVLSEEGKVQQDRVWNETVEILSAADSRVQSIIQEYLS